MKRLLVACALLAGCSSASNDLGLDALLRVANAQFVRGATPADQSGPAISSFANSSNVIIAGQLSKPLSGIVPPETGSVAVFLEGDTGYWLVLPGAADPTALNQLSFSAKLSFSPLLAPGVYRLVGRAVSLDGKFGPPSTATLATADLAPPGALVVSLRWDVDADLDLHVVPPDGTEIWAKHISSASSGGVLDFDSNSQCLLDGRRRESVSFAAAPPSGHYLARVDTFSLCGEADANWEVDVFFEGNPLAFARGVGRELDTTMPHEQGAGVLALAFDLP